MPAPGSPYPSSGAELVTVDGRSLPLVGARLVGEARGGIARMVLEQRFDAVAVWERHVTARHDWIGGAVGSEHFIEPTLAARALDVIERADATEANPVSELLWHPITGLQHGELELPETVSYAIYALWNMYRLVFDIAEPTPADELLVLNQAIAATLAQQGDDAEIARRLAAWWATVAR